MAVGAVVPSIAVAVGGALVGVVTSGAAVAPEVGVGVPSTTMVAVGTTGVNVGVAGGGVVGVALGTTVNVGVLVATEAVVAVERGATVGTGVEVGALVAVAAGVLGTGV